ncbi:hypothetical protein NEOLEDRAFT_1176614 [Neolentinus lepideus HHB14362 ss-1]|uniref:Uncharacterized protein n=1 Tax=Neolentinus lepideus HHB14362 ss-1 TaxID=1314782 RepID=A0A165U3X1_9AGAM|nr:hypothetical protein NEOLEDRAFT_1176614 [Neolentinus lepideus HHB14362 ss-1]
MKKTMLPDLPEWLSRTHVQRMGSSLKRQYRQQIEDELRPLELRLLRLRGDRNALAPISCLPVELLSRIFGFVVEWENEELRAKYEQVLRRSIRPGNHSRKDYYRLKWIYICHVCRAWRNVALNCHVLWRRPLFFSTELTKMMLERSGEAEIDIISCAYPGHNPFVHSDSQALQLVPEQMSRVRQLDLVLSDLALQEFLNGCNAVPAPRLRHLSLQSFHSFRVAARNLTHGISSNLFQRDAPNLRTLKLRGWGVDWDSPLLTTLTHLELQSVPARWRASVEDIVNALLRLPTLERLGLANAFRALGDMPVSNTVANLPRLQKLMIRDEIGICAQLLERISLPAGIPIIVSCNWVPVTSDVVPALVQTLVRHFTAESSLPPLHTVHLWLVEGKIGQMKVWRAKADGDEQESDTSAPPILSLTFQRPIELVQCCLHELPLAQICRLTLVAVQDSLRQDLWVEGDPDGENGGLDRGWKYLLLALKGLRVLEVVGTAVRMREVFHSLWECPLPCLRTISLSYAVLDGLAFEALSDMADERQRRRLPIPELVVQQCSLSEEWTKRPLVFEVLSSYVWDDISLTVDQAFSRFYELGEWEYLPPSRLHGEDFLAEW